MMNTHQKNVIIAGVDGSDSSNAAARWAAEEAQRRKAELRLVGSYWVTMGFAGPGAMMEPNNIDDIREAALTVLTDAHDMVEAAFPELEMIAQLRHEQPFTALMKASAHALMTVVGSSGDSEIAGSILGSVALKIASHGPVPVVVVRADPVTGSTHSAGPVLVGLDGSAGSEQALSFAFEEASMRGKRLIALHSWPDSAANGFLREYPPNEDYGTELGDEQRLLAEQLSGWAEKYPDVPVTTVVRRGQPAATVLRYCGETPEADRPALIVVGSRGHGGFVGLLLGSTSQSLITHATSPVAVVRGNTGS